MDGLTRTPFEKTAKYLTVTGFCVLVAMAVWILVDIFSSIFRLGLPGMVDWVEVLNVICIALPLPYVTLQRRHICMDLVSRHLSKRQKYVQEIIVPVFILFYSSILSWRISVEAIYSLRHLESVNVGIIVYWFPGKIMLAFGFITMSFALIIQIITAILHKNESEASGE